MKSIFDMCEKTKVYLGNEEYLYCVWSFTNKNERKDFIKKISGAGIMNLCLKEKIDNDEIRYLITAYV